MEHICRRVFKLSEPMTKLREAKNVLVEIGCLFADSLEPEAVLRLSEFKVQLATRLQTESPDLLLNSPGRKLEADANHRNSLLKVAQSDENVSKYI